MVLEAFKKPSWEPSSEAPGAREPDPEREPLRRFSEPPLSTLMGAPNRIFAETAAGVSGKPRTARLRERQLGGWFGGSETGPKASDIVSIVADPRQRSVIYDVFNATANGA